MVVGVKAELILINTDVLSEWFLEVGDVARASPHVPPRSWTKSPLRFSLLLFAGLQYLKTLQFLFPMLTMVYLIFAVLVSVLTNPEDEQLPSCFSLNIQALYSGA